MFSFPRVVLLLYMVAVLSVLVACGGGDPEYCERSERLLPTPVQATALSSMCIELNAAGEEVPCVLRGTAD